MGCGVVLPRNREESEHGRAEENAGRYHQLVTPSTSGKRPAEIAGATGERITRMTTTQTNTVSKTEMMP